MATHAVALNDGFCQTCFSLTKGPDSTTSARAVSSECLVRCSRRIEPNAGTDIVSPWICTVSARTTSTDAGAGDPAGSFAPLTSPLPAPTHVQSWTPPMSSSSAPAPPD